MEELIKLVTSKVGIPEAQAKSAVETVVGYLKDKLPGPLAQHVDSALGLASSGLGNVDVAGLAGSLGGMFGKKD
ncbi:MAG: hypothetical protein QM756_39140 [Polyangiaceae bacterium]